MSYTTEQFFSQLEASNGTTADLLRLFSDVSGAVITRDGRPDVYYIYSGRLADGTHTGSVVQELTSEAGGFSGYRINDTYAAQVLIDPRESWPQSFEQFYPFR